MTFPNPNPPWHHAVTEAASSVVLEVGATYHRIAVRETSAEVLELLNDSVGDFIELHTTSGDSFPINKEWLGYCTPASTYVEVG